MSLAQTFLELERTAARYFGMTGVLVTSSKTAATDGTVAETTQESVVLLEGPLDESKRYADPNITGTFYLPAKGLDVVPATSSRLVAGGRTWQVYAVQPAQVQGVTTGWRLDCGEVPSG